MYNVVTGHLVRLAPGAHHVGVIVGQHGDHIDALGAQLGQFRDVLGDMVGGADRGEGA